MRHRTLLLVALAQCAPVDARPAQLPCGGWRATFAAPGPDVGFYDHQVYDDGGGAALYATGPFTSIGPDPVHGVVRWTGSRWIQVGDLQRADDLFVYDDGTGAKLFASGDLDANPSVYRHGVACWSGGAWIPATSFPAFAENSEAWFEVVDIGTGPVLYAGGRVYLTSAPAAAVGMVRWDGSAWIAMTTGLASYATLHHPIAFDSGSGLELHALLGGRVLRWDGAAWQPLPAIAGASWLLDLVVGNVGGSNALYVVGAGALPSFGGVARFDGASWDYLQGGLWNGQASQALPFVGAAAIHDDGSGPRLVVGGDFTTAGGNPAAGVATWDGTTWRALGSEHGDPIAANSFASFDDGHGPTLHVAGGFSHLGRVGAANAAIWRNGRWAACADGDGVVDGVAALHAFDDGSGEALFACGGFRGVGGEPIAGVARWDGTSWSALGDPRDTTGSARVLVDFDGGSGPELHVGGRFTRIGGTAAANVARWDGSAWHPLGTGIGAVTQYLTEVYALATHDDGHGPALYAAGYEFLPLTTVGEVVRWDGGTWTSIAPDTDGLVGDLVVHDDGTGIALYAAGQFTRIGGVVAPGIARWDGTSWSAVGGAQILSSWRLGDLQVYDDGDGPELYVQGFSFGYLETIPGRFDTVSRWDGSTWTGWTGFMAGGWMSVIHDGNRPVLCSPQSPYYATGETRMRTFDGATWSELPGTIEGFTGGIASWDAEGDGVPDIYVPGSFARAAGQPMAGIARYVPCGTEGPVVCAGDGSVVACPCGNSGAPGRGCPNSSHPDGARLSAGGLASLGADTLRFQGEALTGTFAIHLQGSEVAGGNGVPFEDGLVCAGGNVVRLGSAPVSNGASSFPPRGTTRVSQLGHVVLPGQTRVYQALYRNSAGFCTSGSSNTTNALLILWSL